MELGAEVENIWWVEEAADVPLGGAAVVAAGADVVAGAAEVVAVVDDGYDAVVEETKLVVAADEGTAEDDGDGATDEVGIVGVLTVALNMSTDLEIIPPAKIASP